MKITKERLNKIIKEEVEAVISEGFFSRVGSKLGLGPKDTDNAISNFSYRYDKFRSAIGALEYYADNPKRWNPEDVEEYLKAKIGVYEAFHAANTAMFEAGANKEQKKKFIRLKKKLDSHRDLMEQIDMEMSSYDEYAEKAAAAEREQERRIAAAKQRSADRDAEEKARKKQQAKDRADSRAYAAWKEKSDSDAIKRRVAGMTAYERDPCIDRCKEEYADDLRRGYTDDYDKCRDACTGDADGSRRI